MKRYLLSFIAISLTSGCASVPETLQVQDDSHLVPFKSVIERKVAEAPLGKPARWGGIVVGKLASDEFTELEIVYAPTRYNHSPRKPKSAELRFKALVKNDSILSEVERGSFVTVLGEISEPKVGLINKQIYTYPTIQTETLYVWHQQTSELNFLDLSSNNDSPWISVPPWGRNRFERN